MSRQNFSAAENLEREKSKNTETSLTKSAVKVLGFAATKREIRNVAVFLDRDGTICRDAHYLSRPEQFELLPDVAEGIRLLNTLDVKVIVVTNQSGIARGYFTEDDLDRIHRRMKYELYKSGARLDAIYYCPHHPNDGCNCRKPKIGLLQRAERDFNLDLKSCFIIGDRQLDVDTGLNAGCTSILVPGSETENGIKADYVLPNLYEAANLVEKILQHKTIEIRKYGIEY